MAQMTISEKIKILNQGFIKESKIVVLWHPMLLIHKDILGILLENADYNTFCCIFYTPELDIFQLILLGFGSDPI